MKAKVYIAGPYTNGDVEQNVRTSFETANDIADLGFAPFVPHYTHFWNLLFPRPYEFWLKLDREFLKCCDCVLRIDGFSKGADAEVELATSIGIPVFHNIKELLSHYEK